MPVAKALEKKPETSKKPEAPKKTPLELADERVVKARADFDLAAREVEDATRAAQILHYNTKRGL